MQKKYVSPFVIGANFIKKQKIRASQHFRVGLWEWELSFFKNFRFPCKESIMELPTVS